MAAGSTEQEQVVRATNLTKTVSKVMAVLDGDPSTTVDMLMDTINEVIPWDELSQADNILVSDIVLLVEAEVRKYEVENEPIKQTSQIALRGMFQVAKSAAQIYLAK